MHFQTKQHHNLVLVVLVLSLSGIIPVFAQNSNLTENQDIKIGQWTINNGTFSMDENPHWYASAKLNNDRIHISIYQEPEEYQSQNGGVEVEIPGIQEAVFNVDQSVYSRQQVENPLEAELAHLLVCTYNQQKFVFRRTVTYTRASGTFRDKTEFIQDCIKKALPKASSDTLVSFAQLFFGKEIKLGQNRTSNTYPIIEASIDNSEYVKLNPSNAKKIYRYGWNLHAQPGQNVKFRMQLNTYEIRATTYGLTSRYGSEFSEGRKIYIDRKKSLFDSKGIAEIDYGNLEGQELLKLRYQGWKDNSLPFEGGIFLRWGRPEEKWLDDNNFPLADKVTNPTTDNLIYNLLNDLNVAYDWDRSFWIEYRGNRSSQYQPDYDSTKVLYGLELKGFPQLQEIMEKSEIEVSETALVKARNAMDSLLDISNGEVLWKEITSFRNELSGWHSSLKVFKLARLYKEFPELRQDNPIEKVLDFWVENMKKNPDPVRYYGKAGVIYTDDLNSRAYAIAALNLGYEIFSKPEYKESCDVQIKRFQEKLKEKGILDSIKKLEGWKDKTFGFTPEIGRQMCEAVSLYGQVCALIGDEEGLKQAQNWIKVALTREGIQGQNAFQNYESATFKDRCGFIAILRGKSIFSELPLTNDILLN